LGYSFYNSWPYVIFKEKYRYQGIIVPSNFQYPENHHLQPRLKAKPLRLLYPEQRHEQQQTPGAALPLLFFIQCHHPGRNGPLLLDLFWPRQSRALHPFINGSVIPFIHLRDFHQAINQASEKAQVSQVNFQKTVEALKIPDQNETK
jgi:hypothetical protein